MGTTTNDGPRPVLLLDVGLACTGVAVATLRDDGPHLALSLIRPDEFLAPASINDKRSHVRWGDAAAQLYLSLSSLVLCCAAQSNGEGAIVFAEVPVLGARSAGAMRSMAMALAVYRSVIARRLATHREFTRNDVLAAAFGKKKPVGDGKEATRRLVRSTFAIDDSALSLEGRLGGTLTKACQTLHDNAYDAAAVLFAARDTHELRVLAGWGDWKASREEVTAR